MCMNLPHEHEERTDPAVWAKAADAWGLLRRSALRQLHLRTAYRAWRLERPARALSYEFRATRSAQCPNEIEPEENQ